MYALIQNNSVAAYPYSVAQLRRDNPNVSFPEQMSDSVLAEWNVYPVAPVTPPAHDDLMENLVEGTPVLVGDAWTQTWSVVAATPEQIAERQEAIRSRITRRVQQRLDDFAATRGYDNIVSACSYATSQHAKYGPEGRYCVTAREDTWDVMFQIEASVVAGTRPMPRSYEEIEPDLPVLAWPI